MMLMNKGTPRPLVPGSSRRNARPVTGCARFGCESFVPHPYNGVHSACEYPTLHYPTNPANPLGLAADTPPHSRRVTVAPGPLPVLIRSTGANQHRRTNIFLRSADIRHITPRMHPFRPAPRRHTHELAEAAKGREGRSVKPVIASGHIQ